MRHATLKIDGMSCNHCVNAVDRALKGLAGVQVGAVEIGSATLAYDAEVIRLEQIVSAVEEEGYGVTTSQG